jgi:hypothetical protein
MKVKVIDKQDTAGKVAGLFRFGEVSMSDVQSMVRNVSNKAGKRQITELHILDHGNKHSLQFGNTSISSMNIASYTSELMKLRSKFAPTAFVRLYHCKIGNNRYILTELARIWGVTVYAGTGNTNAAFGFNFGNYNAGSPNGTFISDAGLP